MNKKISKVLKYILSAGIAAVLLYFSFREVEWKDFVAGLSSCRWEFILLSMLAGIAAFWFRGLRWRQLLLPIDPSTRKITTLMQRDSQLRTINTEMNLDIGLDIGIT